MDQLDAIRANIAATEAEIAMLKTNGKLLEAAIIHKKLVSLVVVGYMWDSLSYPFVDALIICSDEEGNRYFGEQEIFQYKGRDLCAKCYAPKLEYGTRTEACIVCDKPAGECTHQNEDLTNTNDDPDTHAWCICETGF